MVNLVVNKVTRNLVGLAAAGVFAFGAGSERGNSGETTGSATDLQECVSYFGDRAAANMPTNRVAVVTAIACGAMLSCETNQATEDYLADYVSANQDELSGLVAPLLPDVEGVASEYALRQCVLMETHGADGAMSLSVRGETPQVFFES